MILRFKFLADFLPRLFGDPLRSFAMNQQVLLLLTPIPDNRDMESSKNPFASAFVSALIAVAVASLLRAVGIGWEITSGLTLIAFVISFHIDIRERHSPQ